jgi:predicted AlkP superfamily pyrophosphatase or phosphodiesterase
MKTTKLTLAVIAAAVALGSSTHGMTNTSTGRTADIKHVLLLSIDGMHAVDFYNCAHGIAGVNGGYPYCPNMSALSESAIKLREPDDDRRSRRLRP